MKEERLRRQIRWTKPNINGKLPVARGGHSGVIIDNQIVYFGGHYFGGNNNFVYLNDTLVFDTDAQVWLDVKCKGTPPSERYNHSASLVGNRMFVFGGKGPNGDVLGDMAYLDIETWRWHPVKWTTKAPSPRFDHAHVVVGNKVVVYGGWDGKTSCRDIWVFDTDSFTWLAPRTSGQHPGPRHGHTMTLLEDGNIAAIGGYTVGPRLSKPEYRGDIVLLDTETMVWTKPVVQGGALQPRFGHTASCDEDGIVLLGGWSGTKREWISRGDINIEHTEEQKGISQGTHVHILNTAKYEWESPKSYGLKIENKYGHTVSLVGDRLVLFGGWDGSRAVNELVIGTMNLVLSA